MVDILDGLDDEEPPPSDGMTAVATAQPEAVHNGPTRPINPPPPADASRPVQPALPPLSEDEYKAAVLRGLAALNTKAERFVQAIERLDARFAVGTAGIPAGPPAQLAQASQQQAQGPMPAAWICPVHGTSKLIPAGTSKTTGRAYNAFYACPERGCPEKPPR